MTPRPHRVVEGIFRIDPQPILPPLELLLAACFVIVLVVLIALFNLWYLPKFSAPTAAAIFGGEMEGLVALAIGAEVSIQFYELRTKRAQQGPTIAPWPISYPFDPAKWSDTTVDRDAKQPGQKPPELPPSKDGGP